MAKRRRGVEAARSWARRIVEELRDDPDALRLVVEVVREISKREISRRAG